MADEGTSTLPTEGSSHFLDPKRAKNEDDRSSWLKALETFVKETKPHVLDLGGKGLRTKDAVAVLGFLPDSQVVELNLESNCVGAGMVYLSCMLVKTKIRKLNVSCCRLYPEDLLRLAEVLKDSSVTDLSCGAVEGEFDPNEAHRFISSLQRSKLKTLTPDFFHFFPSVQISPLLKEFCNTSITCLDLRSRELSSEDLISVFENLSHSSVTDLNIQDIKIPPEALQELSQRLAQTKIKTLNFDGVGVNDDQFDFLVEGIVNSNITNFSLQDNWFSSLGPLFTRLKETQLITLSLRNSYRLGSEKLIYPDFLKHSKLTSLDLHNCRLNDKAGEKLMENLRFSIVTKLDISSNDLGLLTVRKFSEFVKDINLTDLDVSLNPIPLDGLYILGKCFKESKLINIGMSGIVSLCLSGPDHLFSFLKLTEGSTISRIEMNGYLTWSGSPPTCGLQLLAGTTFKELHLSSNSIYQDVSKLVIPLKYSNITHLNLSADRISDKTAVVLAECLKESVIRRLNLNNNHITSQGAKALACSFKDTDLLYLHLNGNKIEDNGLQSLAEHAKDTAISVLDVCNNPGKRILLVDQVLLQNKVIVHRLVSVFKRIAPQTNNDEFCFDRNSDDSGVNVLLEECMWFYKTVVDKPHTIIVLLEEENVLFSREAIRRLVVEEFPRQFSNFIACRVEADVTEHVSILEKAEEMGIAAVVESLLLHRPIYMLDEEKDILHPFAYKLLVKYKQPICNLAVEPRGLVRITEYFMEHADVEGAQDVISLLRDANIS